MQVTKLCRVIALTVLLLVGCGREEGLRPLAADAVILAFGDSLTFGTGAGRNESYPKVLERLTGRTVVNAGVPGEVTAKGLTRLPGLLGKHQPDLVVLIHGGNDMLRRHSRAQAANNLRSMIGLARNSGADAVLLGVPAPGLILSTASFYEEVAEETATPIDSDARAGILQYPSNKSDPVHPNGKGYRMLAGAVRELLTEHGAL